MSGAIVLHGLEAYGSVLAPPSAGAACLLRKLSERIWTEIGTDARALYFNKLCDAYTSSSSLVNCNGKAVVLPSG